jgi:hypothetical protein
MNDQEAIDKAFELNAQWEIAEPDQRGLFHTRAYCPNCETQIRKTTEGYRCACSQWRFASDKTAERRKLIPDEAWKR